MKKYLLTTFILGGGVFGNLAHAQLDQFPTECRAEEKAFKNWYDHKTIVSLPTGDAILNGNFIKNSTFRRSDIDEQLSKVEGAQEMHRRADRKLWASSSFSVLGGTIGGFGLAFLNFAKTPEERRLSTNMLGIGVGLVFVSDYFAQTRLEGMNRAYHHYNRQILAKSLVQNTNGTACYDAFLKSFDENTIFLSRYNTYTRNGKRSFNGFFGSNLKNVMQNSPSAMEQLKKYRTKMIPAKLLTYGAMTAMIVGYSRNISRYQSGIKPDGLSNGLIYGGLGGVLLGGIADQNAKKNLHQAVWYFNRDALLRSSISRNLEEK